MSCDHFLLRHTLLDDSLLIAGEAGGRHLLCDSSAAAAAAASGDASAAAAAASSEYELPSPFCSGVNPAVQAYAHCTLLLNHYQTALAYSKNVTTSMPLSWQSLVECHSTSS